MGSSPHAGRGSGSRGSRSSDSQRHSRRSCLHSGGPAALRGVWGSARRSDLARGPPRLSLPRWGLDGRGPRRNGAVSHYGGLGDHSSGGPPRPRRRWWRPAFEEVGRIWVGPRPRRGATLLLSVYFVVSAGWPSQRTATPLASWRPGSASLAAQTPPARTASPGPCRRTPRSGSSRPPSSRSRETDPWPVPPSPSTFPASDCPSVGPESAPGTPMYPLLRGPCRGSPSESHLQAPGPTLRAPGFGEQPPAVDTRAEDGPGLRSGSCRLLEGRAAAGKRGGGKEGAGAVWAAGVFPAPHRRGRGRRGVK